MDLSTKLSIQPPCLIEKIEFFFVFLEGNFAEGIEKFYYLCDNKMRKGQLN